MEFKHEGIVTIAGKNLEYRWIEEGIKDNPVLILLHEGLGSVGLWKDFPDKLSGATGCDVFVYSRAGYGKSDPVSLPRPLTYMHDEGLLVLPELLKLFDRDVILVGHSDGASIAVITAGTCRDSGIKALVLMAPHVFTESLCIDSIKYARKLYENTEFRGKLTRYHDSVDVAFKGWCDAWLDPGFLEWNIEKYLPGISVPVLIIQGEDDEYGTEAQVDSIRNGVRVPVEYYLFPECKHSPHRDQPELTLHTINKFLKQRVFG